MIKLTPSPGINDLATQTLNSTGWSESNLIRWRDGYLEKFGGWQRLFDQPVVGTGRTLHAFQDLDGIKYMAIGTNVELDIYDIGSGLQNITPLRDTANLSNPLTTVALSSIVTVSDTAHGAEEGDQITIPTQAAIGGIIIYGDYLITEIVDANTYRFDAGTPAVTSVSGGGAVPVYVTVMSDATVTVTLANHGYQVADLFPINVSTTVGGLTLVGAYTVTTVADANTLTFEAATTAGSADSQSENGGNVRIYYRLSVGLSSSALTAGYGTGGYGLGPYGMSSGGTGTFLVPLRYWSLDNFGQNLLASPTNGGLYEWIPPKGVANFATIVSGAPTAMTGMFVAMPQAQVVALGAEVSGTQDPLLVRWCDNGDYTDWTATITNQAGSYRLSRGSAIIGGLQGPQTGFIWTDLDLWQMEYSGVPYVYGFTIVATGCGLIAPKAMAVMGRDVMWMSTQGFWAYGTVPPTVLPCPVWDQVFKRLDTANADKCIAAANTTLNEVMWFYPSIDGNGEIDSYVKYNKNTDLWDYGLLVRTGWIDQNVFGNPMGVDADGRVQQHEVGYNDDSGAMVAVRARSGYADISDGTQIMFVDQVIPDFNWFGTDPIVLLTIYSTPYSGADPIVHGPYTMTPTTGYITIRARARQIAFQYEMDGANMSFRVGATRVRAAPAGRY